MHTLRIGRRKFEARDLADASLIYCRERDASGEGGSTFPVGYIDDGKWHVSYNGNVWARGKWTPGTLPVLRVAGVFS